MSILIDYYARLRKDNIRIQAILDDLEDRRLLYTVAIALYVFIIGYLLLTIQSHPSLSLQYALLLVIEISFVLGAFFIIGRKAALVSPFHPVNAHDKLFIHLCEGLVLIPVLIHVLYVDVLHAPIYFGQVSLVHILQNITLCSYLVAGVLTGVFFWCMTTRGHLYFIPMCLSFLTICFLFGVNIASSILGGDYEMLVNIAIGCYLMGVVCMVVLYKILDNSYVNHNPAK